MQRCFHNESIENEILMQMRNDKKHQSEVYLNDSVGTDKEGNNMTYFDIIKNQSEEVDDSVDMKLQLKRMCECVKDTLKGREKLIIDLRYGINNGRIKTQREIATLLGISRSYVSRIEKKALNRLKKAMEQNGDENIVT
jgi:RNA polymerase sporulation-specific sigma factor